MQTETGQNSTPAASGVDIAAIEREMNAFWQELGREDAQGGVIRACVLNLVFYTDSRAAAREADEVLIEVTLAVPSRALLLVADAAATEPTISAQVLSRCTLPTANSKQVCCEQVTITATGAQVNELPSIVAPLLLSDLPTFLCWFAPPAIESRVFRRLSELADRVVIDSGRAVDAHAHLTALARHFTVNAKGAVFSDLNWARLTPWRALLAGFYDVADYRPHLARVHQVEIDYAPVGARADTLPADALLMAGWLASRLRWRLTSAMVAGATTVFNFERSDGGALAVRLTRAKRAIDGSTTITRLSLSANEPHAFFQVRESDEQPRLTTEVELGAEHRPCHTCGHEPESTARLLAKELEILSHDRVYEQAVVAAGAMVQALTNI